MLSCLKLSFDESQCFLKFSDWWKHIVWQESLEVVLTSLLLHKCSVPVGQDLYRQKKLLNDMHWERFIPNCLLLGNCKSGGLNRFLLVLKGGALLKMGGLG